EIRRAGSRPARRASDPLQRRAAGPGPARRLDEALRRLLARPLRSAREPPGEDGLSFPRLKPGDFHLGWDSPAVLWPALPGQGAAARGGVPMGVGVVPTPLAADSALALALGRRGTPPPGKSRVGMGGIDDPAPPARQLRLIADEGPELSKAPTAKPAACVPA